VDDEQGGVGFRDVVDGRGVAPDFGMSRVGGS
jgi:hypothetical protein